MRLTGHREMARAEYSVGCDEMGRIKALDIMVNINAGTPDSVSGGVSRWLCDTIWSKPHLPTNIRLQSYEYLSCLFIMYFFALLPIFAGISISHLPTLNLHIISCHI